MNHTIVTEGFGVRIRPVKMEDASYLVWLRHLEHAKGKVGDSAMDVRGQEEWLREYFKREGDYYFMIETPCGIPMGSFGIYDMVGKSAEFGRWIIAPESPAAIPGAILGIDIGFETLGLQQLRTKVVLTNRRVIQLERRVGFKETNHEPSIQIIGGKPAPLVHMALNAEDWFRNRPKLKAAAVIMSVHVAEWEQASKTLFSEVSKA
jgi:RimJ/RimL family protein N-acetyltransferase